MRVLVVHLEVTGSLWWSETGWKTHSSVRSADHVGFVSPKMGFEFGVFGWGSVQFPSPVRSRTAVDSQSKWSHTCNRPLVVQASDGDESLCAKC